LKKNEKAYIKTSLVFIACLLPASAYSQYSLYQCNTKITTGKNKTGETQKVIKR
jgi:cell division protein FtsL